MTRRPPPASALLLPLLLSGLASTLPLIAPPPAAAQDLASFEKRTTTHVLPNGWTFLIVERHDAPVFAFATVADVGSAQEVNGITGLAHMFEHMAFKGTPNIGTTDYAAEKKAMDATEVAYQAYQAARTALKPDPAKVEKLLADFRARQAEAHRYVVKNEFADAVESQGGVSLNAFTSSDETAYFYSLPINKLELFCFLESDRFLHPVFREFYEERDVVQEERRLSVDSQPFGRLFEQLTSVAFFAHPYGQPVVGYMSDLESFTRTDAERFFERYYAPGNLVTAIVGDVDPKRLVPMLDKYFGRIPARPRPDPLRTVEPPQIAEKTVVLTDRSQPVYVEAYHKPAQAHPDQLVYDAIDDIMSTGRTSRLYRTLVTDKKLAASVSSFSSYPGNKYPNLWMVLAIPAVGVPMEQVQATIRTELERLKSEDVSDEELARFRRRERAKLVRLLRSNQGIAQQLAENQRIFGDWRELFRRIDELDKVSKADIRRVANEALRPDNRTVARIETAAAPAAAAQAKESSR